MATLARFVLGLAGMHYAEELLSAVPRPCARALDVGCGEGAFARQLARICGHVDALDRVRLPAFPRDVPNLHFIHADFETWTPEPAAYDFVCALASLHHLSLEPAVSKMRAALRPGGVLGIVGLYRTDFVSLALSTLAYPVRLLQRRGPPMRAPMMEPRQTLGELRQALGSGVRRRLQWRYTFVATINGPTDKRS